jgi:hypothetical protein
MRVFALAITLTIAVSRLPAQTGTQPAPGKSATADDKTSRLTAELERLRNDWGNLQRYREANDSLTRVPNDNRVVFMGNSITEGWAPLFAELFPGKPYIGRGISGQTTPQMLLRFRQDVIALEPRVVVILAGTNDNAGKTGPSTLEMIEDNHATMAELARAHGIRVVL